MAILGFALAPKQPIPQETDAAWLGTVQSWMMLVEGAWSKLRRALPESEQRTVPPWPRGDKPSSNMTDATARNDE